MKWLDYANFTLQQKCWKESLAYGQFVSLNSASEKVWTPRICEHGKTFVELTKELQSGALGSSLHSRVRQGRVSNSNLSLLIFW